MAEHAGVPVVNALTDEFHPCQLLADLLTVREHKGDARRADGRLRRRRRLQHGQLLAARRRHRRACTCGSARPRATSPSEAMVDRADGDRARRPAAPPCSSADPVEAVAGADVVVTDTWVSMGKEERGRPRGWRSFAPTRVTAELLAHAAPDAIVLHCLPAYRGKEIAAESSTARRAWSGTRPRTGGTPRRRSSPGCWSSAMSDAVTPPLRPATKNARHQQIVDLVDPPRGALPGRARRRCSPSSGVQVTQATLSRDLVELDAVKVRTPSGALVYAVPGRGRRPTTGGAGRDRRRPATGWPGSAPSCSSAPRPAPTSSCCAPRRAPPSSSPPPSTRPSSPDVLGTIAGDDTVLVIGRDPAGGDALARRFLALADSSRRPDQPRRATRTRTD